MLASEKIKLVKLPPAITGSKIKSLLANKIGGLYNKSKNNSSVSS